MVHLLVLEQPFLENAYPTDSKILNGGGALVPMYLLPILLDPSPFRIKMLSHFVAVGRHSDRPQSRIARPCLARRVGRASLMQHEVHT